MRWRSGQASLALCAGLASSCAGKRRMIWSRDPCVLQLAWRRVWACFPKHVPRSGVETPPQPRLEDMYGGR